MRTPLLVTALRHSLLLLLLAVALPGFAQTQTPQLMTYQGYLTDGNGNVLGGTNGAKLYDVVFRLWDVPSGGTIGGLDELYAEIQTVTVNNGYFSVLLGQGNAYNVEPHSAALSALFATNAASRYIEITVQGIGVSGANVTLLPRLQLVSAPYAFLAANANTIVSAANGATLLSATPGGGGGVTINGTVQAAGLNVSGPITNNTGPTVMGSATATSLNVTGTATASAFAGNGSQLTGIDTNSLVQQVVQALCPPGSIVAFGGTNIPAGWLLCNGTNVSRTTYPRLFAAIGTAWGNSTGGTTNFNLPDLRGMFLRGVNLSRADAYQDPDNSSRPGSVGGNSGNQVGSLQTNALQNVVGSLGDFDTFSALKGTHDGPFYTTTGSSSGGVGTGGGDTWVKLMMDLSKAARTSSETRPNNANVNYIIKY